MHSLKSHLRFAKQLVTLMDVKFSIMGLRFGIDPILDFIPGFGNILASITSLYLFWIAYKLGVPAWVYGRMAWNMAIDYIVGIVPYIGIVFDVFFRSNIRNYAMLERFIDPEILEGEIVND